MLCVDEKSQIQALDLTAPTLPMLPGTPARATHDYKRNGTSSLFAALEIGSGKVLGSLHSRHRAVEFKKFLKLIDEQVPPEVEVHLILDNYATHKTPAIEALAARPPALRPPLHADRGKLAQPGRALVRRAHQPQTQTRQPPTTSASSTPTSATGSTTGTRTPTPTSGQKPPTRSSKPSPHTANELTTHDTGDFDGTP